MKDNLKELLPLVDKEGNVVGSATRGKCHNGSMLLHPVVHLHVFNINGELYLQKRPTWKAIQPGKWDSSVGGHVDYGETPDISITREMDEELGISDLKPRYIGNYIFESQSERELVYVYIANYQGNIHPSTSELDGGRFWTIQEISDAIGKGLLTPNFEEEIKWMSSIGVLEFKNFVFTVP